MSESYTFSTPPPPSATPRVLLVVPPTGQYIREDRCQTPLEDLHTIAYRPPIDLLYLAAMVERQGGAPTVKDYPAFGGSWEDYIRDLQALQPDIIVLSITTPTLENDVRAAILAKEQCARALVGAKGAHFLTLDQEALIKYPDLDFVFRGEYEETMSELYQRVSEQLPAAPARYDLGGIAGLTWRRGGLELERNPDRGLVKDLDCLPYPARHLVNPMHYIRPDLGVPQTTLVTERGCPFTCSFCLAPAVSGAKVRRRSPENVVGEIRECVEKHNTRDFLFRSDLFTADKKWVARLCEAIIASGLNIRWACNSRVDTIERETLRLMRKAGCWLVAFGVESGSEELLERMDKRIDKDEARAALKILREEKVKSSIYLLIGMPWETRETFRETVEFAKELDPDFVEFFYVYPFMGTRLYEDAVQAGVLRRGELPAQAYNRPAMPTLSLTVDELVSMRAEALREFYLRPGYIARTLLSARHPRVLYNYMRYGLRQLKSILNQLPAPHTEAAQPLREADKKA